MIIVPISATSPEEHRILRGAKRPGASIHSQEPEPFQPRRLPHILSHTYNVNEHLLRSQYGGIRSG